MMKTEKSRVISCAESKKLTIVSHFKELGSLTSNEEEIQSHIKAFGVLLLEDAGNQPSRKKKKNRKLA